jgi:hypothetical protein
MPRGWCCATPTKRTTSIATGVFKRERLRDDRVTASAVAAPADDRLQDGDETLRFLPDTLCGAQHCEASDRRCLPQVECGAATGTAMRGLRCSPATLSKWERAMSRHRIRPAAVSRLCHVFLLLVELRGKNAAASPSILAVASRTSI